ncbi:MAG: hypothetical protein ACYDHW_08175 [Syntrophorhabdaceae bacterium]
MSRKEKPTRSAQHSGTKDSRMLKLLGFSANVAQIIGTIVTIIAFVYAYMQYTTYMKEISRKPNVILDMFYEEIPETSKHEKVPTLSGFKFPASSEFSEPVKLFVSMGNIGDITAKEVLLTVVFNNKLRILRVDDTRSRMKLPAPGIQAFQYYSENISLPPHFGPIPILFFTASLRKGVEKKVLIGGYYVQSGGQKHKAYNLFYDSNKKDFVSEAVEIIGEPGDIIKGPIPNPAPLQLEK